MRRVVFLFTVFLLTAISASAQTAPSDFPKFEIFGSYSHYSADVSFVTRLLVVNPLIVGVTPDLGGLSVTNERIGSNGWGTGGAVNFSKSLGLAVDFGYHKKDIDILGLDVPERDVSAFTYLFGPRWTARGDRVEGFGHFLVGGTRRSLEDFGSRNDFTLGLGGGMDIKVSRNFAIRAIQFDYTPFRGEDVTTICGCKGWKNNYKFSVGATFRSN